MTKIIIIEDDPMISEIYQKKFVDSGFEVFLAESGDQALNIAKEGQVDVVLSDLMLPRMDGFEIIRRLRSDFDPKIKIIISSNLSQKEDRDKAIELGADGFIAKSEFSPAELVTEVKRILGQYSEQEKNLSRTDQADPISEKSASRILIIEDEEIFIEMFGDKLKQEGYAVSFARNGAWGVKEAMSEDFDLFIIDMVMPAMGGEEMVTKLKMEEKTKNVPIIILSVSVEDEVVRRVEDLGVQAFFAKTQVTPSDLANKVNELLR